MVGDLKSAVSLSKVSLDKEILRQLFWDSAYIHIHVDKAYVCNTIVV